MHLIPPTPVVSAGREPVLPKLHGASQQLLSLFFGGRTWHTALVAVVPENEDLRFSFREHELGRHPSVPIIPERHRSRKSQGQGARLECRSVSLYQRVVRLSSIVESRAASERNSH